MDIVTDGSSDAPASTPSHAPQPAKIDPVTTTSSPAIHVSIEQEIAFGGGKVKVLATPAVRHLARVQSVDLARVAATGRDGRVLKADLLNYLSDPGAHSVKPAAAKPAAPAPSQPTPKPTVTAEDKVQASFYLYQPRFTDGVFVKVEVLRGYRKAMVKKMQEALLVPHFGYCDEITMDNLIKVREEFKALTKGTGLKISFMPFIVKACSLALRKYPLLNSSLSSDQSSVRLLGCAYFIEPNISIRLFTRVPTILVLLWTLQTA